MKLKHTKMTKNDMARICITPSWKLIENGLAEVKSNHKFNLHTIEYCKLWNEISPYHNCKTYYLGFSIWQFWCLHLRIINYIFISKTHSKYNGLFVMTYKIHLRRFYWYCSIILENNKENYWHRVYQHKYVS